MENCIFCKIVKGEVPSHKIYEDEEFLVFLDIRPLSPGHAIVIPKKHFRWVWDLPAGRQGCPNAGRYFEITQKIAKAIQKSFGTEEVFSKIIGEEVPHAHIWIFPNPQKAIGDKNDFSANAEKIKLEILKI
ncbi:MAG: HIT domain-containing protein [Candidatus Tagabacteria bacterium]